MNISLSLRPEFEKLYEDFAATNPEPLRIEGIHPEQLDIGLTSYRFFEEKLANLATDSNSNGVEDYSPVSYRTTCANAQMKLLGYFHLWHHTEKRYGMEFANRAIKAIWDGFLYFHDAHGVKLQMPYCYAFSLMPLVLEGRPYGSSPNTPPKHRRSFLSQVDKLIGDLSKQFAGAVAPSDFFLWYAYFAKKEGMELLWSNHLNEEKEEMIQDFQGLVCLLNEPSRAEGESPFTNFAIYDRAGLESLFNHIMYPDGTVPDLDYIMEIQKVFCEWFAKGDPITGFPYRFPVVTVNMTTDEHNEFVHEDFAKWAAHVTWGKANFNHHFGGRAKLAMCCRYENDLDDMGASPDSFGNGGVNIGSHRVVTINLPRMAILASATGTDIKEYITEYMDMAARLLIVHRYDILEARIRKNPGYLQFFGKLGWFNLKTMFSTFGVTGTYEMAKIMGQDLMTEEGLAWTDDVLRHIRSECRRWKNMSGLPFNIEEIPGEQACVALLQKDKISYGFICREIKDIEFYSNQYIPLIMDSDIATRLEISGQFMKLISGGGIVHLNVGKQIESDEIMYELMRLAAKSGVNHMAVCYRFGMCANGHTNIVGQEDDCPICGEPIIRARNRVIGYYSEESNWHPVRQKHDARYRTFTNVEEDTGE